MCARKVLKTVVLGSQKVGKTALSQYLNNGEFTGTYRPTVGAQLFVSKLTHAGDTITLGIWDTSGDPKFGKIVEGCITNSRIVFFVFDLIRKKSFQDVKRLWVNCKEIMEPDAKIYLIGNGLDKLERVVTKEEGESFADRSAMTYLETSVKDEVGVSKLIETIHFDFYDDPALRGISDSKIYYVPQKPSTCIIS
jgi:Ras-related protein Rab-18